MKKHILFLLLAFLPMLASAETVVIDGIYYNLNSSTNEATVSSHPDKYKDCVTIPASVTYGGVIYKVTEIGRTAFYYNTSLLSISIPNSVTSIGENAFARCSGLTSFEIPNSVTSIGDYAISECTSLSSVTLGNSLTSIGREAFGRCTKLTSIEIPNSVTTIGSYAFSGCTNLSSVSFGNNVTSIGSYAFSGCTKLTSIEIPNSVTSICAEVFEGCKSIEGIVVASGNTVYDSRENCKAIIETASQTLIVGCKNTIIPNTVKSIGNRAFSGCIGLTSIEIPDNVSSIGSRAFSGCIGLTSIEIPSSVTTIGSYAFDGCKLRNVYVKSTTPPSLPDEADDDVFGYATCLHGILYVPTGAWEAYAFDDNWCFFINIREAASEQQEVKADVAYTLMDTKTFDYAVYDPVNDRVRIVASVNVDESDPNHCWQTIEMNGKSYLYNIGAKKFAVPATDGSSFTLSDTVGSITMTDGENGIVLNGHAETEWALVSNDRMSTDLSLENTVATGVKDIENETMKNGENEKDIYDLSGRQQPKMQKGINIVKMSDGTSKKVLVK